MSSETGPELADTVLRAFLFTDIVDSTGDRATYIRRLLDPSREVENVLPVHLL